MNQVGDWIAKGRDFHERQLATHRKVIRLGTSRFMLTKGHALTISAGIFVAGSVGPAVPDLFFWGLLLGSWFGGWFVFPVPDSSIASKKGPGEVAHRGAAELDRMTPEGIRIYENNMMLQHRLKTPEGLGTVQALYRQREAVKQASAAASVSVETIAALPLAVAQAFAVTAGRHDAAKRRWLDYEVDPQLQFDFPAMTDIAFPPTAAMIRAMHAADQARSLGIPARYESAVALFEEKLAAAEAAAGVHGN